MMLAPDDISVGKYITIMEWKSHEDYSYMGDVLLVKAVSLPFVVVDYLIRGGYVVLSGIRLDVRRVDFMALSPDYVMAVIGSDKTKSQSAPVSKS